MSSRSHPPLSDNGLPLGVPGLRKLLPASPAPVSDAGGTSTGSGWGPSPRLHPRHRSRANVTKIACEPCRKRKGKCFGERPKCTACINKGLECHYQASYQDLRILKRKYDEIQGKVNIYEQLWHLLRCLPERESHDIVRRLREGADVTTIRRQINNGDLQLQLASTPETRLYNGQAVENISEWLDGVLPLGGGGLPAVDPRGGHDANIGDASASASADGASGDIFPPLGMEPKNASTVVTWQSTLWSDIGQRSPRQFSTQGQTMSTRGNCHAKAMSSAEGRQRSSQSQIASRAESMQADHMPDGLPRTHGLDQAPLTLDEPELKDFIGTWTTITNDIDWILHLLALYFYWEYPAFAPLSKEHFLRDFRDGRHRYCSPLLVNALLALGCCFSIYPVTRANCEDSHSAGGHFFTESQRLFEQETDHYSLTTIQALGIMSIREASCGRSSESRYYAGQSLQLAFDMGLHHTHDEGDKDELAVQLATFWGAFLLDHAHSLATGSLPHCSYLPHLPSKPINMEGIEASPWALDTDDGTPIQLQCEQSSNERSVHKCFCELSELVHQSLYLMHSVGKPLTARGLLSIYTEYLNWYDKVPEALRLGHNFTPAVLFVHMYYHFAIMQLFQPLTNLSIIGSRVSPRDVCLQAASAIQGLLKSYAQLYTLKRAPSFMPYFALTSTIAHLTIMAVTMQANDMDAAAKADPHVSEAIQQGIACLAEMTSCHHITEQAPHILRYLAKKWSISVDIDTGAALNTEEYERLIRPLVSKLDLVAPTMAAEDDVEERTSRQVGKTAESMEDPLFWPFTSQGWPMLSKSKELEEAGFAVL
ncbi:hypothetical protein FVEN_g9698 [Fusarium venenatum]|uniref:Zn(2)-C6 fungal-type domain-containing protein n=1 Tax=Fusarium venenatum TaxID=56646 RepID=A0A2L2U020_9HYPO|nr:uncharacterized protein FVRRES_11003 [Fusarium venenatum]KAG8352268.1 hypothetical protein FVEN_g9698 [Fusarium venenatum]CEI70926.1 unnamed protein product [Fusarium venenatum]